MGADCCRVGWHILAIPSRLIHHAEGQGQHLIWSDKQKFLTFNDLLKRPFFRLDTSPLHRNKKELDIPSDYSRRPAYFFDSATICDDLIIQCKWCALLKRSGYSSITSLSIARIWEQYNALPFLWMTCHFSIEVSRNAMEICLECPISYSALPLKSTVSRRLFLRFHTVQQTWAFTNRPSVSSRGRPALVSLDPHVRDQHVFAFAYDYPLASWVPVWNSSCSLYGKIRQRTQSV